MGIETALAVAGPIIGGLMSSGESGGQTTTANREPWAPAQPYILDNLKDTKKLQDFYRQNPLNAQQQTSYQNTFGDLDNFRQNIAPGLMGFANNAMTSNYQRQRGGQPGSGSGYGGAIQPGGLMQSNQQGAFSAPRGVGYGLLDLAAQNPYTSGAIAKDEPIAVSQAPQLSMEEQIEKYLREKQYKEENRSGDGDR